MSKFFLLLGILVICAAAAVAFAITEAPAVGSAAPDFSLNTNEGNQAALKGFPRQMGRPLFLSQRLHQRLHAGSS